MGAASSITCKYTEDNKKGKENNNNNNTIFLNQESV